MSCPNQFPKLFWRKAPFLDPEEAGPLKGVIGRGTDLFSISTSFMVRSISAFISPIPGNHSLSGLTRLILLMLLSPRNLWPICSRAVRTILVLTSLTSSSWTLMHLWPPSSMRLLTLVTGGAVIRRPSGREVKTRVSMSVMLACSSLPKKKVALISTPLLRVMLLVRRRRLLLVFSTFLPAHSSRAVLAMMSLVWETITSLLVCRPLARLRAAMLSFRVVYILLDLGLHSNQVVLLSFTRYVSLLYLYNPLSCVFNPKPALFFFSML